MTIFWVNTVNPNVAWTFLRPIIFGSFGVWPKMTQFSESRLILLVCQVLLPSGHTITTIDILNMTEHGLHPGCVPKTYEAILILSRAPTHINAHNCAQNYPQNARKNPQNARKNPQTPAKSKNLVNLYNFGSAQLNRNQLGCAAPYFENKMLVRRQGDADGKHSHDIPRLTFWGNARYDHKFDETPDCAKRLIFFRSWKAQGESI